MGSDKETPVSQRQLQDHKELDEEKRAGDLRLAEKNHAQTMELLSEIREGLKANTVALREHSKECPAIRRTAKNAEEIGYLSRRFWIIAGAAVASSGGIAGLIKWIG